LGALRSLAALAVTLGALAPVAVAAQRGVDMSAGTLSSSARALADHREAGWSCLERRIDALLPPDAHVLVVMDEPLLSYQRALEMVAPHAEVVARRSEADYELWLVPAPRNRCSSLAPKVRRIS
jgi:hypothetical protein